MRKMDSLSANEKTKAVESTSISLCPTASRLHGSQVEIDMRAWGSLPEVSKLTVVGEGIEVRGGQAQEYICVCVCVCVCVCPGRLMEV